MTWSDSLKNALGGLVGQAEQNLINTYLTKENLAAILAKLEEAGLGAQVKSWLDQTKTNIPITADQVRAALGDQRVQEWAAKFGISPETLSSVLAQVLPQAVAAAGPSVARHRPDEPGDAPLVCRKPRCQRSAPQGPRGSQCLRPA